MLESCLRIHAKSEGRFLSTIYLLCLYRNICRSQHVSIPMQGLVNDIHTVGVKSLETARCGARSVVSDRAPVSDCSLLFEIFLTHKYILSKHFFCYLFLPRATPPTYQLGLVLIHRNMRSLIFKIKKKNATLPYKSLTSSCPRHNYE